MPVWDKRECENVVTFHLADLNRFVQEAMGIFKDFHALTPAEQAIVLADSAGIMIANNRHYEGLAFAFAARTRAPDDPKILYQLGVCYLESGMNFEGALALLEALRLDPEMKESHNSLGNALGDLGIEATDFSPDLGSKMLALALSAHRRSIEIDPEYWFGIVGLTNCLAKAKLFDAAESLATHWLRRGPSSDHAQRLSGILRRVRIGREALGQRDSQLPTVEYSVEAVRAALHQLETLIPRKLPYFWASAEARARYRAGEKQAAVIALGQGGDAKAALASLDQALQLEPSCTEPVLFWLRGEMLVKLARREEAVRAFERALDNDAIHHSLHPKQIRSVQRSLGLLLGMKAFDERSGTLARRAVELLRTARAEDSMPQQAWNALVDLASTAPHVMPTARMNSPRVTLDRVGSARDTSDGICSCCGQRFVESTRVRPSAGRKWTGLLAQHANEGVCPRCHKEYGIEKGHEKDWEQEDWREHHQARIHSINRSVDAFALAEELAGQWPDLAEAANRRGEWLREKEDVAAILDCFRTRCAQQVDYAPFRKWVESMGPVLAACEEDLRSDEPEAVRNVPQRLGSALQRYLQLQQDIDADIAKVSEKIESLRTKIPDAEQGVKTAEKTYSQIQARVQEEEGRYYELKRGILRKILIVGLIGSGSGMLVGGIAGALSKGHSVVGLGLALGIPLFVVGMAVGYLLNLKTVVEARNAVSFARFDMGEADRFVTSCEGHLLDIKSAIQRCQQKIEKLEAVRDKLFPGENVR